MVPETSGKEGRKEKVEAGKQDAGRPWAKAPHPCPSNARFNHRASTGQRMAHRGRRSHHHGAPLQPPQPLGPMTSFPPWLARLPTRRRRTAVNHVDEASRWVCDRNKFARCQRAVLRHTRHVGAASGQDVRLHHAAAASCLKRPARSLSSVNANEHRHRNRCAPRAQTVHHLVWHTTPKNSSPISLTPR